MNVNNSRNFYVRRQACRGENYAPNSCGPNKLSAQGGRCWGLALLVGMVLLLVPGIAAAQGSVARPRIAAQVNESALTVLRGNTHPLARRLNDQGAVADSLPLRRMLLLLRRGPDEDAALKQLMDRQQSNASPNYHQWLTPQQFGQQFGPADADIQIVSNWLQSHGFQIAKVSAGRTLIEFSGTAGQVRNAFHTEIHRYLVNGEQHFANNSDPQIPAALAPVVAGPVTLHDFPKKPQSRNLGVFRKSMATGKMVPLFGFAGCGTECNAVGPGDFAKIYHVDSLWSPGINGHLIDGAGQTIAITGDSEICTASSPDFTSSCAGNDDVAMFRSLFGLPPNPPNVIVDGPDPGFNVDETEGDLDVQWSGAVAKNATIDFVIAEQTETTSGIDLAAEYIVDNNLAPVLSESFGLCELFLGTNGNLFEAALWEQAAAQGITVIVASGDNGSAGCDDSTLPTPNAAQVFGAGVSGVASTPFNVAVGGTDFDVTLPAPGSYQTTYWGPNTTVGGIVDVSALSYIPETSWNDSCAQSFTAALTGCTSLPNLSSVNIDAGSGGQSNCASENTVGTNTTCTGAYSKPSWQTVATGSGLTAGNDLFRDIPDISLFAGTGQVGRSFYVICEADIMTGICNVTAGFVDVQVAGGTSASAPSFAGIMALVNQNMAVNHPTLSARQGNANYVLYNLAAKQSALNCNSSASGGPNSACNFNDVTKGNNSVPCLGGSFGCSDTTVSTTTYGVLETSSTGAPSGTLAFNAGTGLDLATGLGSINATNLVSNWATAVGAFTPTTTTLCVTTTAPPAACAAAPITITHGDTVYVNISVTPTPGTTPPTAEDVSLIGSGTTAPVDLFTSNDYLVSNADIYPLTNGSIGTTTKYLVGGSYNVIAHYAGDGTFGVSNSTPSPLVTVNPEASTAAVTVKTFNVLTGIATPSTSAPYGDVNFFRVDVTGSASGQASATGTVTLTDNGAGIMDPNGVTTTSPFALNAEGFLEDQTPFLAVGSHSFQAKFNGDPSYSASTVSTAVPFTVTKAPTISTASSSMNPVSANAPVALTAVIDTQSASNPSGGSLGLAPTGTVTFLSGTTPLGTVNSPVPGFDLNGFVELTASLNTQLIATDNITAVYNGDGNYMTSTSPAILITVTGGTTISVTPATATINITAAGQSGTDLITVNGSNVLNADNVALTCAVTASPAGAVYPPTCNAFGVPDTNFTAPNVINLTAANMTGNATMTVSTTPKSAAVFRPTDHPLGPSWFLVSEVGAFIACFLLLGISEQKRRGPVLLAMLLFAILAVGTSCGSAYSGGSGGGNPGTTPGMYTITVTATPSPGLVQQTSITVTVQ